MLNDRYMQRNRNRQRIAPPSWWVRCAIIALACLQVVAPTWHICSMGAGSTAPGQQISTPRCSCDMPSMGNSGKPGEAVLSNYQTEAFCLAKLLQHVLGNSQFRLVLDFSAVTIATLLEPPAASPLLRTIPVDRARGPPRLLIG